MNNNELDNNYTIDNNERKKTKSSSNLIIHNNEKKHSYTNEKQLSKKEINKNEIENKVTKNKKHFYRRKTNSNCQLLDFSNILLNKKKVVDKIIDENTLYILLKTQGDNTYFLNKIFREENTLYIIKKIINKKEKDDIDKYILVTFLKSLSHVMDNISLTKYPMESLLALLINICINLKIVEFDEGTFLFRIDDIGKEFYIILSGEVQVLLPKFYKVEMTEQEYINHLIFLYIYNERHLFLYTLKQNNKIFAMTESIIKEKIKRLIIIENDKINLDLYLSYLSGEKFVPNYEGIKKGNKKEYNKKKEISICGYYKITELKEGNCFGEVALKNENSLRTASIFTNTKCSFAFLDVEHYNKTMKNIQKKTKMENIEFLLSTGIFKGLSIEHFENKYWSLFCSRVISKGETMFINGEDNKEEVIFIKTGEFSLETKLSINRFNEIINYLRIKKTKYQKDNSNDIFNFENNNEKKNISVNIFGDIEENSTINENEKNNKKNRFDIINEDMVKDNKIEVNIGYLSKGEILGLDNMIYNDKYICTAKCVSDKCEFFSLQKRYFDNIIFKYSFLQRNMHKFILLKKKFMYETFLKVQNNIIKNAKINLNYIYKQGKKEKRKTNHNIKILTNTSLNIYINHYYNKYLSKKKTEIRLFK